jgi:hypothetical protein
MVTMPDDDKFSKAVDEQRRRERDEAVERARDDEGGFSEIRGDLVEKDGVPDAIIEYEVGAGWVDSAEDRAGDN